MTTTATTTATTNTAAGKRWYVVHAYSGFEKSVQRALEDRINRAGMGSLFRQVIQVQPCTAMTARIVGRAIGVLA